MSDITFATFKQAYENSCTKLGKEKSDDLVRDFYGDYDGDIHNVPADEWFMIEIVLEKHASHASPKANAKRRPPTIDTKAIFARWNSAGKRDEFDFG